jgi:tRNA (guanine37-N1)-methyltransferase
MRLHVLTLTPEAFAWLGEYGVVGRALRGGRATLRAWNIRSYTDDPHGRVDDRPYGGGAGMVLRAEPLARTLEAVRAADPALARVVCLTPRGRRFVQADARRLAASSPSLALVCGRYEGVDERFVEACADEELSVGDFVLSGGETAALVVLDAVLRLLPGVVGDPASLTGESFDVPGLAPPVYTRPAVWRGRAVPGVLLGGDHAAIERWRRDEARGHTLERRPDLLATEGDPSHEGG